MTLMLDFVAWDVLWRGDELVCYSDDCIVVSGSYANVQLSSPVTTLPKKLGFALIVQTNHLQWPSCIPFDRSKAIDEQIFVKHGTCPNLLSE
jgi:hypothetical protein